MSAIKFKQMVINPLFILWATFFSITSLGTCILSAFTNVNWKDMDTQGHMLIWVAIATNWASAMGALLMEIGKKSDPDDFTGGSVPGKIMPSADNTPTKQTNEQNQNSPVPVPPVTKP